MIDYIHGIHESLPENIIGKSAIPARKHMLIMNPVATSNYTSESDKFHDSVAKLRFVCILARVAIQTAVAFPRTSVKGPDDDNIKEVE